MTLFSDIRRRGRKRRQKQADAFVSRQQVQRVPVGTCGSAGCKVLG